jgi:phosphatidylglycerol:prolipoprotein diacylglycerol transferase
VTPFRWLQWAGLTAGLVTGATVAGAHGADGNRALVAGFVLIVAGVIGAHALHARAGASAAVLALPLIVAVWPVVTALGLPVRESADAFAVGAATATVFGRIGCLVRGCCAGRPTERWFGVVLADDHGRWARRIPTQAIDAAWAALLVPLGIWLAANAGAGTAFLVVGVLYGGGRAVTDSARAARPSGRRMQIAWAAVAAGAALGLTMTGL